MRRFAPLLFCLVAWGSALSAHAQGAWSEQAVELHARATADYGSWVWARHDLNLLPVQRRCFDRIATQAGAIVRLLPERVGVNRIRPQTLADAARRLSNLEASAENECTVIRRTEGDVDVDMSRHPMAQRMPRDRMILRLGARYEGVPRVRRGGYAIVPSGMSRAAIGTFPLHWLRVELIGAAGYLPMYGAAGSIGGRVVATAPWSIARIGVGAAASVVWATDRVGQIEFSWMGLQLEIPIEVGFEISEQIGLTITGGPMFTQAGQLRVSEQAIDFNVGLLLEVVL